MTTCRFGDVVLVPFPFTDQSSTKRRPAVVVSSNEYNSRSRDVIILAISSRGGREHDRPIARWQEAGLLKPSFLKPVIATIDSALVIRTLGSLSGPDPRSLQQLIDSLFPRVSL